MKENQKAVMKGAAVDAVKLVRGVANGLKQKQYDNDLEYVPQREVYEAVERACAEYEAVYAAVFDALDF